MFITHQLALAYNSISNGLAEARVKVVKAMMKKTGLKEGLKLEEKMRYLNP